MRSLRRASDFAEFGAAPIALDLHLDAYEGPAWKIKPFRNRCGWLTIAEARLPMSFGTWRRTLVACVSDWGEIFSSAEAEAVFHIPTSLPREADDYEPDCFEAILDDLQLAFIRETDRNNIHFLADLHEGIDWEITAYEARCRKIENGIADATRLLHAERRRTGLSDQALVGIDAKLARLSGMADMLGAGMRAHVRAMRTKSEEVETEVMAALGRPGLLDRTCTVRWRAISRYGRVAVKLPVLQSEGWREDTFGSRMAFGPLGWSRRPHVAAE